MSSIVKCDECGKLMHTDNREEKGVYVIDPLYGFMKFHLCRKCYAKKFPQIEPSEEETE